MRTEILILLMAGFKPVVVSKILDISLDSVYYNNRALKKGYKVLNKLDVNNLKANLWGGIKNDNNNKGL